MQATMFQTYDVPGAGSPDTTPVVIARAPKGVAVRALVRNVGAITIFLAGQPEDVVTEVGPSSSTYRLGPQESDSFVLAPEQAMFAVGAVPGGVVSVSVSDALPLT